MAHTIRRVLPLLNRVLVQRLEAPKKSLGGIILPEKADSEMQMAKVVETGPGASDESGNFRATLVAVGQTILLPKYSGTKVDVSGENYFIYKDSEVLAILEN